MQVPKRGQTQKKLTQNIEKRQENNKRSDNDIEKENGSREGRGNERPEGATFVLLDLLKNKK